MIWDKVAALCSRTLLTASMTSGIRAYTINSSTLVRSEGLTLDRAGIDVPDVASKTASGLAHKKLTSRDTDV
jgi:hypothetical protein